jgi:branched-chain amino acid transport system substrate-binding protein
MSSKKTFAVLLIFMMVLTFALAGCGGGQEAVDEGENQNPETVKIGVLIPISGPLSTVGENLKLAYEFAKEEINNNGGIESLGGAKLEFVYGDQQGDPKVGASETERLIQREKVSALMGTFPSTVSYTQTEVAERYQVPYLEPSAMMDEITERGFKYTFRTIKPASYWAQEQIKFIKEMDENSDENIQKLALIYENTDQGQSTSKGWRKYAEEMGYEIVVDESYPRDISDFSPLMMKLREADPDVILMTSYVSDAILLQKALAEYEINTVANIGTSSGFAFPAFVEECGDLSDYLFDLTEWNPDLSHTELVAEKHEKFKNWEKNEDGRSWNGAAAFCYATTYVLEDAIERAASTDRDAIRDALAETKITEGPATILPYSPIEFDENGQAKGTRLILVQYQDGKRVTVWPEDVKAAEPVFPMPKWSER